MKKEIEDELNDISPFLAKLKKDMPKVEPFKTPELYFDTLTDKIMDKARVLELQSEVKVIPTTAKTETVWLQKLLGWLDHSISTLLQPRYAFAMATVAILVVIGWKLTVSPAEQFADDDFASAEDIQRYVQENIDDFDIELLQMHGNLAEVTTQNESDKLKILEDESDSLNVSDDEIKQYLKDNLDESDLKALENEL